MNVGIVNAGAVTLKLSVVADDDTVIADAEADPWDGEDTGVLDQLGERLDELGAEVGAVGHRIVHGGDRFDDATIVDDDVEASLRELRSLAPLHQDRTLDALDAVRGWLPDAPHVACFDTTFHRTISPVASTYPVPAEWRERWPLRRFGFHGSSHEHVARRAPDIVGRDPDARVISCHLGSGVSLCAIADGRSVDTTMGATPLEGPVMATRSGTIDPGMVLWLVEHAGLAPSEVSSALRDRSGLAGLAGGSGDMRDVLDAMWRGDERAKLAFDVYVHRLRAGIGAMAASLGGVDVLAFTGGVGQHLAVVRERVVEALGHLGVAVDHERNRSTESDGDVSAPNAACATAVVATAEHLTIARATRRCIADR